LQSIQTYKNTIFAIVISLPNFPDIGEQTQLGLGVARTSKRAEK